MQNLDIPIFKKIYDLYKTFHGCRPSIPKQDRYTVWQKCEESLLAVLEGILLASQISKAEKIPVFEKTSPKLNLCGGFVVAGECLSVVRIPTARFGV